LISLKPNWQDNQDWSALETVKLKHKAWIYKEDDTSICSDHEVANCLNDFILPACLCTDDLYVRYVPTLSYKSNGNTFQFIEITHEDVLHQLNCLNPSKSCGPDKCHP